MQASVVQKGAGQLWCRAHGVQSSVEQCIGAVYVGGKSLSVIPYGMVVKVLPSVRRRDRAQAKLR